MLLCASKFATAKIECKASKWASKHLCSNIYLAGDCTSFYEIFISDMINEDTLSTTKDAATPKALTLTQANAR